ncbi:hypothetical protein AHAS_Ahas17G0193100 [Arachis hypogaea]
MPFQVITVGEFKRLLGVKPTPKKELIGATIVTHPKSLKYPKEFDARTQWSQCSTIGRIIESLSDQFCIHFDVADLNKAIAMISIDVLHLAHVKAKSDGSLVL